MEKLLRVAPLVSIAISLSALGVSVWAASKSAELTQNQFSQRLFADLRPWVSVNPVFDSAKIIDDGVKALKVSFELENHGRAPALQVDLQVVSGTTQSFDGVRDNCRSAHGRSSQFGVSFDTLVLLPGEKRLVTKYIDSGNSKRSADFVGCAIYATPIDDHLHQTGFSYRLEVGGILGRRPDGDVPKKEVSIEPLMLSGLSAD